MATSNVTIRMDENLKHQAEAIFSEMGMNMTTAITLFTKTVVREGRIPFEIKVDKFYSSKNIEHLIMAAKDMDAGENCDEHELL